MISNVTKISPVYAANNQKENGDVLNASEWNSISSAVNTAQTKINDLIDNGTIAGSGSSSASTGNVTIGGTSNDSHIYLNDKGNLCIETTAANVPSGKKGKINIESKDDIQVKPGDDFTITSSHRPAENMDEVSVKIHDGEDHPVKLQLNAADIVLTTKDKNLTMEKDANGAETATAMYDDPAVMNVTVNSAKNTRGYLKVRAQAIDLRSESHGGIALQPKGEDGSGNENKIKFEHGGGDGLEFGTFNTEKTSIYTDEYRFNKNGIWKMASRNTVVSDKYDGEDETTHFKYEKQADDFYDVIDSEHASASTQNIIESANVYGSCATPNHQYTCYRTQSDPASTPVATISSVYAKENVIYNNMQMSANAVASLLKRISGGTDFSSYTRTTSFTVAVELANFKLYSSINPTFQEFSTNSPFVISGDGPDLYVEIPTIYASTTSGYGPYHLAVGETYNPSNSCLTITRTAASSYTIKVEAPDQNYWEGTVTTAALAAGIYKIPYVNSQSLSNGTWPAAQSATDSTQTYYYTFEQHWSNLLDNLTLECDKRDIRVEDVTSLYSEQYVDDIIHDYEEDTTGAYKVVYDIQHATGIVDGIYNYFAFGLIVGSDEFDDFGELISYAADNTDCLVVTTNLQPGEVGSYSGTHIYRVYKITPVANKVTMEDIITVVNYFKTNNQTGPFASV